MLFFDFKPYIFFPFSINSSAISTAEFKYPPPLSLTSISKLVIPSPSNSSKAVLNCSDVFDPKDFIYGGF